MIRKIVNILGIPCLVLVLGAGGGAGYLAAKGTLNRASLKTAVAAVTSQPAVAAATRPGAAASQPESRSNGEPLSEAMEPETAATAKLEMMRRDLANEQALLEAGRVNLQRQQEQFEQTRKQWDAGKQKDQAGTQQGGVQKELDYLSIIRPAQALTLLRAKTEEQASRILLAMEPRKGKKIIEMCKTADEMNWVKRVLEQIRQLDNDRARALTGG